MKKTRSILSNGTILNVKNFCGHNTMKSSPSDC